MPSIYLRIVLSVQAALTNCNRRGGSNHQLLLFMVLKAKKPEIRVQADSVPGEGPLLVHSKPSSVSSHGGRDEEALWVLF